MSLSFSDLRTEWFGNIRNDLLAGTVVALALIPEAIAFSIIAGVDPKVASMPRFVLPLLLLLSAAARDDLGGDRRNGAGYGIASGRTWSPISAGSDDSDRHLADFGRHL